METKHYRLECGTKEEDTYLFSVKIPARSEIVEQMDKQNTKVTTSDIGFSTGILFNVQHSVKLCFAKPGLLSKAESPKPVNPYEYQPMASSSGHDPSTLDMLIFVCLSSKPNEEVQVTSLRVRFLSESDGLDFGPADREIKSMGPATKECDYEIGIQKYQNYKYWMWSGESFENSTVWTDKISELRFTLNVCRREYKPIKFLAETSENDFLLPFQSHGGLLDTKHLFLSTHLSDTKIICGDQDFPAHRLVLCSRSKFFENLFLSTVDEIREQREIRLNETPSYVMRELLRFMYTGEVEGFEDAVKILFWAADKYLVDDLHTKCERHLVKRVNLDNATEMYTVGTRCNGKMLVQIAKKLILSNREKLLADPQSFKSFTLQHPELMFELFHTTDVNLNLSSRK